MQDDMTGIENNPLNLIHPIIYNTQIINQARQGVRNFKQDNRNQRPNPIFSKENLEKHKEHSWLKKCQTRLYNFSDYIDEEDFYEDITETIDKLSDMISEEVLLKSPKKLISLDLETTGLNKTIKRVGGKNLIYNKIVGVCIGVSENQGFYIPVRHNETDSVKNFSDKIIIKLLQFLVDNYHIIYHNAVFDQEVMALNGVVFKKDSSFTDTMIMAILCGYRLEFRSVGLKILSEELLQRKMLEIGEIMEGGGNILLQTLPASNAYVYGCSDAMNTYGLFNYIMDTENPYYEQKNTTILEHKMVSITRSLFRVGLPIQYDLAYKSLKTIIRRLIILETIFYDTITDDSVSISSAEQLGTYFYNILKEQFEKKYCPGHVLNKTEKGFDIFCKKINKDFGMEVKVKELKSGTKIVANCDDRVINSLYDNISVWQIDESIEDEIYIICEVMTEYRSLFHEMNIFYKMVRFCYNDDMNICRTGIGLKLMGADTLRYSNQSSRNGSFDSVQIVEKKTKTNINYLIGDGITGFNAQGISNKPGNLIKLKKVKNFSKIDKAINEKHQRLNKMVDGVIFDLFKTGKYSGAYFDGQI